MKNLFLTQENNKTTDNTLILELFDAIKESKKKLLS